MVVKLVDNAGVPLYAVAFVSDSTIVVGGGGGPGAHGVKNKLAAYHLEKQEALEKTSELVLPDNSDSPTSLAAATSGDAVWLGVNVPSANGVDHLRRIDVSEAGKLEDKQNTWNLFRERSIDVYQRATSVAGNMVAVTSSGDPAKVIILDTHSQDLIHFPFPLELVDAALTNYDEHEQRFVVVANPAVLQVRTLGKPDVAWAEATAPKGGRWARVTPLDGSTFAAAAVLGNRKGATLTIFRILENKLEPIRQVTIPGFKGVTALAAKANRIAVANPAGDISIYDVSQDSLKLTNRLKSVHSFPVTSLALSPSGTAVASTSLDGSLIVNAGLKSAGVLKATFGWLFVSGLLIAIVALLTARVIASQISDISSLSPSPAGAAQPSEAKVLEMPLHAEPGMGHGPVVLSYADEGDHPPAGQRRAHEGHGPVVHSDWSEEAKISSTAAAHSEL